ncbi:hypothetical protein [Amycolatopsis eburnea]|uniref:Uncharacterized protein n=1 Tax=Amycolatopsis eburnea TaxID=2267691 RepID=A0A3R9KLS0_9PSEU|nr:hypothetical protein [Amycolatopsis eburnea]RSD19498.1 hypothetical protein EIY87_14440 [Amycolatopsis eburnea]
MTIEMSPELTKMIRSWRIEEGPSRREVAARATRHLGLDPSDNQLAGRALCSEAAELLGGEPWN